MTNVISVQKVIDRETYQKIKKLGSYFSMIITLRGVSVSLNKDSPYFNHDAKVMIELGFTREEGSLSRFTL